MKLEKRKLVIEIEKRTTDKRTGHISFQFRLGPFKKTMSTTIGSALRRTLLSMTKAVAITSVCGNFGDGNAIREDLFEVSLNFQRVHIKSPFFPYIGIGRIKKKGPAVITAQDLELEDGLEVVNPYQYICSINESYNIDMCVMINSPNSNQINEYIDPINPIKFINQDFIKQKENFFGKMSNESLDILLKQENISNLEFLKNRKKALITQKNINSPPIKNLKNIKTQTSTNNIKDSKIKLGIPQKLPFDIVVVDPIYLGLQSCGFETVQTTSSSVNEYGDLIKKGVSETDEFLRFVVISRGAIEPASAIEAAIQELKETLSMFEPLSHVFASEKNLLLTLEGISYKKNRKNLSTSYGHELLKKLDIKHLNLPVELELLLRRQGFVTFNNLMEVPLEFLKRIGLKEHDIIVINKSLKLFSLSLNINRDLKWDLIPYSLPF